MCCRTGPRIDCQRSRCSPRGPPGSNQIIDESIAIVINAIRQLLCVGMYVGPAVVAISAKRASWIRNIDVNEPVTVEVPAADALSVAVFVLVVRYFRGPRVSLRVCVVAIISPNQSGYKTIAIKVLAGARYTLTRFGWRRSGAYGRSGPGRRGYPNRRWGLQGLRDLGLRMPIVIANKERDQESRSQSSCPECLHCRCPHDARCDKARA